MDNRSVGTRNLRKGVISVVEARNASPSRAITSSDENPRRAEAPEPRRSKGDRNANAAPL